MKLFIGITLLYLLHSPLIKATTCPSFSCDSADISMNDKCFYVKSTYDGKIDFIKVKPCDRDSDQVCYLPEKEFVWISADQ